MAHALHKSRRIKPLFHSLYYVETCNELVGPISALLHHGSTAPFEEVPTARHRCDISLKGAMLPAP